MIQRLENILEDNFFRPQTLTTTPGFNGWTRTSTGGASAPACVAGGGMQIALAATNEIEIETMSFGDILVYPATGLQRVEFNVSATGIGAADTISFGMASARNDAPLSVTSFAGFRVLGSGSLSNVLIDCRDGVNAANTKNGIAAIGQNIGQAALNSIARKFAIDFTNGLSDIRFYVDGDRVTPGTQFSMGALTSTSYLQPFFQVQKTASTDVPAVTISRVVIQNYFSLGQ